MQGEELDCGLEHAKGFVDGVGDKKDFAVLRFEQSFGDAVIEEREELVVEAVDIEEQDWLGVELECLPCEDFKELFKGSEASRKRDKGIGLFAHERLAGVHGIGDVKLGDAVVGDFQVNEYFRNDSDDAAVGGECCLCGSLHEADVCSSVDQTDVSFGENS